MSHPMVGRKVIITGFCRADSGAVIKDAAGKYVKQVVNTGIFLGIGSYYEELQAGIAQSSVAIVELQDGTVTEVAFHNLQFVDSFETWQTEQRKALTNRCVCYGMDANKYDLKA